MAASRANASPQMRPYPRIDTSSHPAGIRGNRNNIYSWVETPMELHDGRRNMPGRGEDVPPVPTIPADPDANPSHATTQEASVADGFPQEKKSSNQNPDQSSMRDSAVFAPRTETSNTTRQQPSQRITTAEPVPIPTQSTSVSEGKPKPIHNDMDSIDNSRSPKAPSNRAFIPSYHPDAFTGPNSPPLDTHFPGQVPHPSQQVKGGTWKHGLFDCTSDMGTCCMGILCPCIIYGKTQYRLKQRSEKQDPTNMLGYESISGSCIAMSVLCGFHWVLAGIQHARIRRTYHLPGGMGSDCAKAICCCCCTLIQDEKEVKYREEQARHLSAASKSTPYLAPQGMSYAPPPR